MFHRLFLKQAFFRESMITGYYYLRTSNCKSNLALKYRDWLWLNVSCSRFNAPDIREAHIKGYPPSPNNAALQNRLGPRGLTGYLRDDLFLLLKKFISFFLSYLNLVIPLRWKKTKALTCTRKQNPEGIWYSKMTPSCKLPFLESLRIWLSHGN